MAEVYAGIGNNEARLWKLLAYAGRYGHQPVREMLRLTTRELHRLVEQLNIIVQEENAPANQGRSYED